MTGIFDLLLGWNGYRTDIEIRVSAESLPWGRKFSCHSCWVLNPRPFNYKSITLTTELSLLPGMANVWLNSTRILTEKRGAAVLIHCSSRSTQSASVACTQQSPVNHLPHFTLAHTCRESQYTHNGLFLSSFFAVGKRVLPSSLREGYALQGAYLGY